MRGETPEVLTDAQENIVSSRYRVGRLWPWWTPWVSAVVVLTVIYGAFAVSLHGTSDLVLQALDEILKK